MSSRSPWASLWPALLAGGLSLAVALVAADSVRKREKRALEVASVTARDAVQNEIEHGMRDQLRALERLAANWERRTGLPREEFEAEAEALAEDYAFLQAVGWVDPEFHVRWIVPRAGNKAAEGLDLGFEARRREALEASRDGLVTSVSRPVDLVQGGLGLIAYVPLDVDGRFDGFVGGVWRIDALFLGLLRNVAPGFGVRVIDDGERVFERGASDAEWSQGRVGPIPGVPRRWSVEVAPRRELIATYRTMMPQALTVAGIAFALGIGFVVNLAGALRIRNQRLVAEMEGRKRAEQELSRVIRELPDHVWSGEVTAAGYRNTHYSPVLGRISGYPTDEFKDSPAAWYAIVHPADVESLQRAHVELLTGQCERIEIDYRIRRADGTLCWLRSRVHSTPTEGGLRLDGITSDITEAKGVEAEQLQSRQEKLLLVERERMTREMHDGLGGQLVSTIAMLERGSSSDPEVAEALRRALDDMRIVMDSLDPVTNDLSTSLGKLRARLAPLLLRNGLELYWQVEDLPGFTHFTPDQTLHFLRIVQEAVTNALVHANASKVSVVIHAGASDSERDVIVVEIRDDGRGLRPGRTVGGRGIGHMKSRAEALCATLRFDDGDSGTRVELQVPVPH